MGILIIAMLMGIMSSERSNNNQISKTIEEELNRYSKTDTSFSATGRGVPTAQEYVVPAGESGWYRIELWGAQGGTNGGRGAYTSGVIRLEAGDVLYFYVGSQLKGSNGGQSTDVRIANGPYSGADDETALRSYETRIMVAAGGGMSNGASGGTLYGYTANMTAKDGAIQSKGTTATSGIASFDLVNENGNLAGIPTSEKSTVTQMTGSFTTRPTSGGVGGSGYISSTDAKIGGVSFISGYAGCNAVVAGGITNKPKYVYKEYTYNSEGDGSYAGSGREYYFLDGRMLAGVNVGHGRARIERVVADDSESEEGVKSTLPVLNGKLKGVYSITDCIKPESGYNMNDTVIKAVSDGNYISISSSVTAPRTVNSVNLTCKTVRLASTSDLDEIAIWHPGLNGKDIRYHHVYVNDYSRTLKANGTPSGRSETEEVTGYRFSAYQPDYTTLLPETGNYYIVPVLAENKAFTAHVSAEYDSNPISVQYINGYKRQSWSVELIKDSKINPSGNKEYKIIELARFKSLSIYKDENKVFNTVRANDAFNELSRNEIEIWRIQPVGDGTYQIMTVAQVFDTGNPTGNLIPQTNASVGDEYNNVIIGKTNVNTARVKFIKIDY